MKPSTVIDIGANTGQFSSAIRAIFPEATVYAFEPHDESYLALKRRFDGDSSFHPIRSAIGDSDGETTFHQNAFSQSSSVLETTALHRQVFPLTADIVSVEVPIRRLDSFAEDLNLVPSLLIKIDVQGYEGHVLRGGERVIRQASVVLIETAFEQLYEGEATFELVYDIMRSYGFRYGGNLDQFNHPSDDRPLYADALFIKDGDADLNSGFTQQAP